MKKIISLILVIACCMACVLTLASCKKDDPTVPTPPAPTYTYKIGVQAGTTGEYFVNGDEDWGFDGIAGFSAKGYSNAGLAVNDMLNGAVDFVVVDQQPALQLAAKVSGIKVVNIPLTVEEYAYGVDKAQPELLTAIDGVISTMKTNGKFNEIVSAYATGTGITGVTSAAFDASKADQQLVVATNANFAPFEYKEGNKFYGIDMEVAAYIAQSLGMELVIMDMDFDSVVTSVGTNNIDIAMAALTVNDERKQSVNFTQSYYDAAQVLIVKSSDTTFNQCTTDAEVLAKLATLVK